MGELISLDTARQRKAASIAKDSGTSTATRDGCERCGSLHFTLYVSGKIHCLHCSAPVTRVHVAQADGKTPDSALADKKYFCRSCDKEIFTLSRARVHCGPCGTWITNLVLVPPRGTPPRSSDLEPKPL